MYLTNQCMKRLNSDAKVNRNRDVRKNIQRTPRFNQ